MEVQNNSTIANDRQLCIVYMISKNARTVLRVAVPPVEGFRITFGPFRLAN